jgi:hypothetical protein
VDISASVALLTIKISDLLDRLEPVKEAFHNAASSLPALCLEGTRERLLNDIWKWFEDPTRERVFWLQGLAGTGKTTVARTIADRAHSRGRLAASFFFSRNIEATRAPSAIIPTIAYQLGRDHSFFRSYICTAIASDRDVRHKGIATQVTTLLERLPRSATSDVFFLIVLDALDECRVEGRCEGGVAVPLLLSKVASLSYIKVLITSRAHSTIKRMLDRPTHYQIALHDIEASIVHEDIRRYLQHSFLDLDISMNTPHPLLTDDACGELVRRAGTLFIYAATVIRWVGDSEAPASRLRQVLKQDAVELPYQNRDLDSMYVQVLLAAAETSGNPHVRMQALRQILAVVVVLMDPVSTTAVTTLAGADGQGEVILPLLSAVLLIEKDGLVRLFHESFRDCLTDERRTSEQFLISPASAHLHMAVRCLETMNTTLHQNICDIKDPSLRNEEVPHLQDHLATNIPSELGYACRYWHIHTQNAGGLSEPLLKNLEIFCLTHLLH